MSARTCSCGARIARKNKSGRCRACAYRAIGAAQSAAWFAWCPPERRDEQRRLRKRHGSAEARRMIEADLR